MIQNTIKQDPFDIYIGFRSVRIHFYQVKFGSNLRNLFFSSPKQKNHIGKTEEMRIRVRINN